MGPSAAAEPAGTINITSRSQQLKPAVSPINACSFFEKPVQSALAALSAAGTPEGSVTLPMELEHVPSLLDLLQRHPQAQRFDLGNHTLAAIPSQHIDAGAFGGSGNGVMLTLDRPLELSNGKLQFCEGMHCMVTSPGVACKSIAFICGDAAWGATHSIANAAYAHGRTTGKVTAGSISMQGLVSVAGQGASLAMEDCQVVNYSLHRSAVSVHGGGSLSASHCVLTSTSHNGLVLYGKDARASAHLDDCSVLCCGKIGIKVLSMGAPGASAQLHMQHCSFQRNAISHITCSGAGAEALLEACVLGMGCLTAGLACYDEGRVLASGCFMHSSNTNTSSSSSSDTNQTDQPGLICKDSDRQSLCTYARAEDEGSTVQLQGCKLVDNPKMQPPESFQTHEYSFDGAQVIVSGLHKQVGSAAGEDAAGLHGGMRFGQLGICFEGVTSKAWLSLEAAVCSAIMRKSTSWLHEQKDACGYGL